VHAKIISGKTDCVAACQHGIRHHITALVLSKREIEDEI
jgi:hypothetical protein